MLGKGEQLTQRNVGPRALHPLVGGNILPNQNMLVRAGNRQRFFSKIRGNRLKFRVLHAGGILFQHKGFACRVKHLFAGARLVLCHLAHCCIRCSNNAAIFASISSICARACCN